MIGKLDYYDVSEALRDAKRSHRRNYVFNKVANWRRVKVWFYELHLVSEGLPDYPEIE